MSESGVSETKILIVEDSRLQAEFLQDILRKHGYQTAIAENGSAAFSLLGQYRPQIIISDIVMPVMDGFEFCRRVKTDDRFRSIPVVLLTALSNPRDVLKSLECGADGFVVKPYEEGPLLERIDAILENLKLRGESSSSAGIELLFSGERFIITAGSRQILDLLLSTYEAAVQKQHELRRAHEQLREFSGQLEERVLARTLELQSEIAERRKTEELLRNTTKELLHADQMKSEFISVASHELRTPLTSIQNAIDIMVKRRAGEITEAQEKFLTMAARNISRLNTLVNDILSISKIESDTFALHYVETDVGALVEDVLSTMRPLADAKSIEVGRQIEEALPALFIDREKIEQVLINLAGNAVKFTPAGGRIMITAVRVEAASPGTVDLHPCLALHVSDTGIGIAPENQAHLFEKFYQVSNSLSTKRPAGTGLGLSIAAGLVKKHGGNLTCASSLGAGSTFTITLPLSESRTAPDPGR